MAITDMKMMDNESQYISTLYAVKWEMYCLYWQNMWKDWELSDCYRVPREACCHSLDARYMTMPGVLQQKTYREYHSTDIVISLLYK